MSQSTKPAHTPGPWIGAARSLGSALQEESSLFGEPSRDPRQEVGAADLEAGRLRGPDMTLGNTQGPWVFRPVHGDGKQEPVALLLETQAHAAPHDNVVLAIREDWFWFLLNTQEGQDRLALIAAAPDLLEACRDLLKVAELLHSGCLNPNVARAVDFDVIDERIARARAAIQRATGGQK